MQRKPSPIISSFLELRRNVDVKIVAAQKMLLNRNLQQTFVNGLLGFITFVAFILAGRAKYHNTMSAHRYGQLSISPFINILLGSFQLFLHSDQPLPEGNNPVRSKPVGEAALSMPEAVASRTD